MTIPQLQRWTRDDWTIPCAVKDPSGAAINLTGYTIGAELWLPGYNIFSDLTAANGGVTGLSPATGQFTVSVPKLLTARALASLSGEDLPTRVLIYWIDPYLRRQTLGVVAFDVFDGRDAGSIDETPGVTIVWSDAAFTIVVASSQGPAGPSNIAAEQITDATPIGRQVMQAPTAAAIRGLLSSPSIGRTEVDDLNYAAKATDVYIGYAGLTAPRTVLLPPAISYPPGQALSIADETGLCSQATPIVINANGTDTIAGGPSVSMAAPDQKLIFHTNGSNRWSYA